MNDDQTKRRERRPVEEKTRPPRKGRFQNVLLGEKEMGSGSGKGDHHNAGKTTENSSSIPLPAAGEFFTKQFRNIFREIRKLDSHQHAPVAMRIISH
jgi:hypothetical protein